MQTNQLDYTTMHRDCIGAVHLSTEEGISTIVGKQKQQNETILFLKKPAPEASRKIGPLTPVSL